MHQQELIKKLDPNEDLYAHLYENDVISADDRELNVKKGTSEMRAQHLVDLIKRRGPRAFLIFIEALEISQYRNLAEILAEDSKHLFFEGERYGSLVIDHINSLSSIPDIKKELRSHYERSFGKILPIPWLANIPLELTEIYVQQEMKSKTER